MKAAVIYESHWGNTEEIARAIAAGLGPDVRVLTTDEATPEAIAGADLIVAGAPVIAFGLPSDHAVEALPGSSRGAPKPPDVTHPTMRTWLAGVHGGHGHVAAFETGLRWSPGGATGAIERALGEAGYERLTKGRRFVVNGSYGPLRDGEVEKARAWAMQLAGICPSLDEAAADAI